MLNAFLQNSENRVRLLRWVLSLFFVVGILMSFKVWWISEARLFPMLPLFEWYGILPISINNFLVIGLITLLIVSPFFNKRWLYAGTFSILLILLLQDQMRWQPWVYLYSCMLVPLLFKRVNPLKSIPYWQILLIGVYFWSGFYKLNSGFVQGTFSDMLEFLFFVENETTRENLLGFGYAIPVIEMGLAILLIFPKYRNAAVMGIVFTHVLILSYLLKVQHNSIVYPWNLAMICFVVLLFYRNPDKILAFRKENIRIKYLTLGGAFFFLFMPVMNLFGLWDSYLSFKLYSGDNGLYCIGIDKSEIGSVDKSLYPYLWKVDEPGDKYWVYVNKWAMDELNVPFYPEMRAFKRVSRTFCEQFPKESLEIVKFKTDFVREGAVIFGCEECTQ